MPQKTIDLSKTVYELCAIEPGVIEVLSGMGFSDITKPGMLHTAGRFMTVPKGAAMKHIELSLIREAFTQQGYTVLEGE